MKRLEPSDFVRRQRNPDDERQVMMTLSSKGKILHQESKCLTETLLEKSALPVADLVRLNAETSALRDALVRNALKTADTPG